MIKKTVSLVVSVVLLVAVGVVGHFGYKHMKKHATTTETVAVVQGL